MTLLFVKLPWARRQPTLPPKGVTQFLRPQPAPTKPRHFWLKVRLTFGASCLLILGLHIRHFAKFGCGSMGIEAMARSTVVTLNLAQQDTWAEHQRFAWSLEDLDVSLLTGKSYQYLTVGDRQQVVHYAIAQDPELSHHVGAVFAVPNPQDPDLMTSVAVVCQAPRGSRQQPSPLANPTLEQGLPTCPPSFHESWNSVYQN